MKGGEEMNDELTKSKLTILKQLYDDKCIPSSQLELYSEYLRRIKDIKIKPSYLYRVLRELISLRYVERIKLGYQQKGVQIESYENIHGYKIKNIYRLTLKGRKYIETQEELFLSARALSEMEEELRTVEGARQKLHHSEQETLQERKTKLLAKSEHCSGDEKKSDGNLVLRTAMENERTVRLIKTDLFGKVCEAGTELYEAKYCSNDEMRAEIQNKGTFSSKATGLIKYQDKEGEERAVIIYNLGGSVTAQRKRTERKMKAELENKYKTKINEEIILGENYETLLYNIKTLMAREQARKKKGGKEGVGKKPRPLIIEIDGSHPTVKYFHCLGVDGIKKMEVYNIPRELRRLYYIQVLARNKATEKYFTEQSVKEAENNSIYSAITQTKNIYVGYEENIEELIRLIKLIKSGKEQEKSLVVICQSSQRKLYEKMFEKVEIITTPHYI